MYLRWPTQHFVAMSLSICFWNNCSVFQNVGLFFLTRRQFTPLFLKIQTSSRILQGHRYVFQKLNENKSMALGCFPQEIKFWRDVKLSLIFVLIPNKTKSRREVGSIFYNWKFKSTVPWSFHIFFKLSLIGHLVFLFKEGWCRYSSKCLILAAIIIRSHNRSIPSRCHKNIHREYIKRVFLGRGLPRWSQGGGWL